jgi:hypothetical protein
MTKGKQLGEWSVKFTSFTLTPGPAGSTLVQGNFEGTSTGEIAGTQLGTVTFVGGKSGTYTLCGTVYLDNGDEVSFPGNGTYESTGKHHWRTQTVYHGSDGSSGIGEGEIDLATRSWTGKAFELKS